MITSKMVRLLAFAGMTGFAAGWLVFGSKPPGETEGARPEAPAVANPPRPETARTEFTLRPADVTADRETPAVAVDSKGRVLLAWASQAGELERALTLARSSDGGKTFARPVEWRKVPIYRYASKAKGKEVTYSTHVLPRLVASGESIHLGWVEAIDGGPKVVFYVATSTDGGQTFSEPIPAHSPEAGKPGFTAMGIGLDGSIVCGWLDGRGGGPRPYSSARVAQSEGFEPERLAYAGPDPQGVCPCCDVAVAQGLDGSRFVAFRNSESGHRDIFIAGPDGAVAVGPDHWKLDGCPHDGPSLTLADGRLDVLWMDAHTGRNRVYHASSPTDGLSFRAREVAPGSTGAQGHPKLTRLGDGRLVAVWDESIGEPPPIQSEVGHGHGSGMTGGGRAIQLATSTGEGFGAPRAVSPRPGSFQQQPAIALGADGHALVAWVELDEGGKKVVFARIEVASGTKP